VNEVDDLIDHPALRRIEVETSTGPISMPAPPVRTSEGAPKYGAPPSLNADGDKIRAEFGG
ncbi:MAG: CoA transferase, partial [Alphaproteobacteria bacterium]